MTSQMVASHQTEKVFFLQAEKLYQKLLSESLVFSLHIYFHISESFSLFIYFHICFSPYISRNSQQ